ncbi:unnamed protein product [Trifolium pratense]|uniref:Uncharacterized protein n=1 Tax=Trifolium pratense TaxID=57577 RepID=A0ACB0LIC3_TRIPR|nr:unnamed protein product [Trifolium pratense]
MYYKSKKKKPTKKPELSPERIAKMDKYNAWVRMRLDKKKRKGCMSKDEHNLCIDRLFAFARLRKEGKPKDDDILQKYIQEASENREALVKASCLKRDKKKAKAFKRKISRQLLKKS